MAPVIVSVLRSTDRLDGPGMTWPFDAFCTCTVVVSKEARSMASEKVTIIDVVIDCATAFCVGVWLTTVGGVVSGGAGGAAVVKVLTYGAASALPVKSLTLVVTVTVWSVEAARSTDGLSGFLRVTGVKAGGDG